MQLRHPEILWALTLLLIPLIIHLFRLRRFKKEAFTNVRLLRQIEMQTRKSAELKKWLVLIVRSLALSMIVLAFAQPYTGQLTQESKTTPYIVYLDNSYSMEYPAEGGTLFSDAVNTLIDHWPDQTPVVVLTNDKILGPGSISELTEAILDLETSNTQLTLAEVLLKAAPFQTDSEDVLILISDFAQFATEDREVVFPEQLRVITASVAPPSFFNISLDSVAVTEQGADYVNLRAYLSQIPEDNSESAPVSIFEKERLLARNAASFTEGKAVTDFSLPSTSDLQAHLDISDQGLPYDNRLFFFFHRSELIKVMHIGSDPSSFISRIYTPDEFTYTQMKPEQVDYNLLKQQNLIILDQLRSLSPELSEALMEQAQSGSVIVQIPSTEEVSRSFDILNRNLGLPVRDSLINSRAKLTDISYDHPLFKNVFLERIENFDYPEVRSYYTLRSPAGPVLGLSGGLAFLYENNGHYAFTAALDPENSTLNSSSLVVPVFYNMALQSVRSTPLYRTSGDSRPADLPVQISGDQVVELEFGNDRFIPRQQNFAEFLRIFPDEQMQASGHYGVVHRGNPITTISVNAKRTESTPADVPDRITGAEAQFSDLREALAILKIQNSVSELWKWFAIFAIGLFLTEMLILKFYK